MTHAFRFRPAATPAERAIGRPRLSQRLSERFDRRLTVVRAAAGYGKSTALALAVENNRLDHRGVDHWLGLEVADEGPDHFLSGLVAAVGLEPIADRAAAITAVLDEVWRQAPTEVCLILDDVHHLVGSESKAILGELLERLPANGHLLLAGRTIPALATARLRAHGELVEVGEDDLNFDDTELGQLTARRSSEAASSELPRHPASADLQLAAGPAASADFLWEEILSRLEPDRLDCLLETAVLDEIDDEQVAALSSGRFTAAQLLDGVPLVDVQDGGVRRLHSLLRGALFERLSPGHRVKAAQVAAEVEAARGNLAGAVALLDGADLVDEAIATAREFVLLPLLRTPMRDLTLVHRIVARRAPDAPLTRLLELQTFGDGSDPDHTIGYSEVAERARELGDDQLEAAAVHRALQGRLLQAEPVPQELRGRLDRLAETVPFAKGVRAHLTSIDAQSAGDTDRALSVLADFNHFGGDVRSVMLSERLADLGRPEQVGVGMSPADLADLPPGGEMFIAWAMWLRGEASPEVALEIAREMIAPTLGRRLDHASVSTLAAAAIISLCAGDTEQARRFSNQCRAVADHCPRFIRVLADVAEAAIAVVDGHEDVAADHLRDALAAVPMAQWPPRPFLLALPLLYLMSPESRSVLDECGMGRALTVAVDAGRALVALRQDDDPGPAALLPWGEPQILRAHLLPPHLAELAVAADHQGAVEAGRLLETLPRLRPLLEHVEQSPSPTAARAAAVRLSGQPTRPVDTVTLTTFGGLAVHRNGRPVTDPDWQRRARVRELLALLIEHRRINRSDAAATLWPDLDGDKATANLRVNLTHLQRVLEPERPRSARPFYVVTDGDHLALNDDLAIDVDEFDRLMARAHEIDRSGAPTEAMETYGEALALYTGDHLAGIDAPWAFSTRLRLSSLAISAAARIGELTLARGEPEAASQWALRARKLNPLDERAARLFVSSLAAAGDRNAAARAFDELEQQLADAGLRPEPETAQLVVRLHLRQ